MAGPMSMRNFLILTLALLSTGCASESAAPVNSVQDRRPLKACQALSTMMRTKEAQQLDWLKKLHHDIETSSIMPIKILGGDRYQWGPFGIDTKSLTYTLTVRPRDDSADTLEYAGQFVEREPEWSATVPELTTALAPDADRQQQP